MMMGWLWMITSVILEHDIWYIILQSSWIKMWYHILTYRTIWHKCVSRARIQSSPTFTMCMGEVSTIWWSMTLLCLHYIFFWLGETFFAMHTFFLCIMLSLGMPRDHFQLAHTHTYICWWVSSSPCSITISQYWRYCDSTADHCEILHHQKDGLETL